MGERLYAKFVNPNAGTDYDKEKVREAELEVGRKYKVIRIEMGSWHTDVWLEGYARAFNSVHFDFYEGDLPHDIYSDPNYNPYLHGDYIDSW